MSDKDTIAITDLAPHELANLRIRADGLDWYIGRKIHALIDAYEDRVSEEDRAEIKQLKERIEDLEGQIEDARCALNG